MRGRLELSFDPAPLHDRRLPVLPTHSHREREIYSVCVCVEKKERGKYLIDTETGQNVEARKMQERERKQDSKAKERKY